MSADSVVETNDIPVWKPEPGIYLIRWRREAGWGEELGSVYVNDNAWWFAGVKGPRPRTLLHTTGELGLAGVAAETLSRLVHKGGPFGAVHLADPERIEATR